MNLEITIYPDLDGFILQKCPICGELFKMPISEIEDDRNFEFFCPSCGLNSESYFTDDVIDMAKKMVANEISMQLHRELKSIEKQTKNDFIKIKSGKKPKLYYTHPIVESTNNYVKTKNSCCNKEFKVKHILKMASVYCPYCGVKDYGNEN